MKKIAALFLAGSFLFFSCSQEKKEEKMRADLKKKQEEFEALRKEITDLQMQIAQLDTTNVNKGKPVKINNLALTQFVHSIDIQGRVDADQSVTVGPQMPGLIKHVDVQSGDKVSAGQVLAELDVAAMQQQLNTLKTQRDLAKDVFNRQKNLWDQKIGTEVQFLQAKTQYESLESQVAALQDQINMGRVTAPMAGTIDQVNMKAGEMGIVGMSNIVIVNTNSLRVKAEVAEAYVSQVKAGDNVDIYLPDANKTIKAKITYAGRMINRVNRTFNVEVALNPNEPDVVPNMVAVLKINDYQNDSAIVAPVSAIQETATGQKFVFVAKSDGKGNLVAERREVTYERAYNGNAEITSGLKEGDKLITAGYSDLNNGDIISSK